MLSSVLKSDRAIEVNVAIMRAFVQLRQQSALNSDLYRYVKQLDEKIDRSEKKYDANLGLILEKLQQMMAQFSLRALSVPTPIDSSAKVPLEEDPKRCSSFSGQQVPINRIGNALIDKAGSAKVGTIVREVAGNFGLKPSDLKASGRMKAVVLPRQLAMYLIRKHVGIGYKEIGRYFGRQDHATIIYACKKIAEAIEQNESIKEIILATEAMLER